MSNPVDGYRSPLVSAVRGVLAPNTRPTDGSTVDHAKCARADSPERRHWSAICASWASLDDLAARL